MWTVSVGIAGAVIYLILNLKFLGTTASDADFFSSVILCLVIMLKLL